MVNTLVAGTLGALIADAAGASVAWIVVLGAVSAIVHVGVVFGLTARFYGGRSRTSGSRPRADA